LRYDILSSLFRNLIYSPLFPLVNDALTQAKWAEKKWVWLINKKEGYLPVFISAENGDKVEVTLEDGSVSSLRIVKSQTVLLTPLP
jgi:hypothetical protein